MTILLSDLDLQLNWTNVSNEQLRQISLKYMHKCRSYGPDMLNLWPFYNLTFKCDLDLQPTWTNVSNGTSNHQDNNCAKLFWNLCINVEVMAQTSSIYDHFIIWPSSATLTFNLPEQMVHMALLLDKENKCANTF